MTFPRLFWQFSALIMLVSLVIAGCNIVPAGDSVRTELVTVVFLISTTPDPDASPQVIIVTATPDRTQVAVPDGIVPETTNTGGTSQFAVTQIANGDIAVSSSSSNVPAGCIAHIVDDGDTVFGLADEYGVNPFIMLEVNGFTEDTAFLDIGDELIVPIDGCPIADIVPPTTAPLEIDSEEDSEVTAEVTAEETESANLTPSPSPTITLAPTAVDSEIEIVEVIRPGDVTAEGVRIRNNGRLVDVAGWTLSDADGNEFAFEELLVFSNAEHTV